MKSIALFIAMFCCFGGAHAAKACEELKSEVAAKLDAKNVKGYVLTIVAADQVGDAKIVGTCDAGHQKLTYKKQ